MKKDNSPNGLKNNNNSIFRNQGKMELEKRRKGKTSKMKRW
jgi:hypothetical protein